VATAQAMVAAMTCFSGSVWRWFHAPFQPVLFALSLGALPDHAGRCATARSAHAALIRDHSIEVTNNMHKRKMLWEKPLDETHDG